MQQMFFKKGLYSLLSITLVLSFLAGCANTDKKPIIVAMKTQHAAPVLTALHQAEYQKALGLMKAKSFDKAFTIFTDLTTFYPNLAGAYVNLALIYKAKSDEEKAEKIISRALDINPNNVDALIQLAAFSQKKGEFNKVEQYLLTAEAADRSSDTVQYNLAVLYELYLQQYDDAIDHYENYIALTSNDDKEIVKRWVQLLERK
jgi:tetratricopeptide (TPR) repeat protein